MKLKILVDMDSILADFLGGVVELHNKETGDTAKVEDVVTWDYKFKDGTDCYTYFKRPGFFRSLKPIPGAQAALKALMVDHDVVIVSSATLTHAPGEKFEWLTEHLPFFPRKSVCFFERKEFIVGDVLIDDYPKNVEGYHSVNPCAHFLTLKYSYNAACPFYHLRADAWPEIMAYITEIPKRWDSVADQTNHTLYDPEIHGTSGSDVYKADKA